MSKLVGEQDQAIENIYAIADTLTTIFARADGQDRATAEVAGQMARERIAAKHGLELGLAIGPTNDSDY